MNLCCNLGAFCPATVCKLTILQPTKKCKLSKIADLDKIGGPKPSKTPSGLLL